jgi:hypothetical protein
VGFVYTPDDLASGVAVSGSYAYVTYGWDATGEDFRVIDVSTPSAPVEVAVLDTPGWALGVAVSGGYAYVASTYDSPYQCGLTVIDVSTPSTPVEVGFLGTPEEAKAVAVSGSHAYVAFGTGILRVIDVSNPSAPVQVGFADARGYPLDVAVSGGYVYVADYTAGLAVFSECPLGWVFGDGFDSGDTSAWSATVPELMGLN